MSTASSSVSASISATSIIIDQHEIYGDGVNLAARLEALAEPGGICVSRVVRDRARDKVDFGFEDLGDQQVKKHHQAGARLPHSTG